MKKKISMLIFLLIIIFPLSVYADNIYNIDMTIKLNKDGSADIKEKWHVKADSGTEWYKQLYNLGNEELSNYEVLMDNKKLTFKNWNVSESLESKNGYYGINKVPEGIELCFGKGDMKEHVFIINYTLSNFIFNTEDSQSIYQTLFPNATMDSFNVVIESYYEFPDTLPVWGYGYKGYAYVEDGKIKMSNEEPLYNDYVVLLVKFPQKTFDNNNTASNFKKFDDILSQAQEGTYSYDYEDVDYSSSKLDILEILLYLSPFIVSVFAIFSTIIKSISDGYGYLNNKKINKKEAPLYRDIPCDKDIYYANALVMLNGFSYKESNIFGAILLKWLKENKISFKTETTGIFNKETSSIDLTLTKTFENAQEQKLYNMLYTASRDGILEQRELEKWARKNYSSFLSIFNSIKETKINELKSSGHIYQRKNKSECKKNNIMDDTIYNDSIKLYGLKKYLEEFSNMKEKEAFEVHLWDEYLMFAFLFGIANKVAKQFNKLYPEIEELMHNQNYNYNTIFYINSLSTRTVSAANSAKSAAQSYSSGGGGFSSGGGGGGSFGGGGSMGGR